MHTERNYIDEDGCATISTDATLDRSAFITYFFFPILSHIIIIQVLTKNEGEVGGVEGLEMESN